MLQSGQELKLPVVAATARPSGTAHATPLPAHAASGTPTSTATAASTGTAPTTPRRVPAAAGGEAPTPWFPATIPFLIAEKQCVTDPQAAWVDDLVELNNVEASSPQSGRGPGAAAGTPALCVTGRRTAAPTP